MLRPLLCTALIVSGAGCARQAASTESNRPRTLVIAYADPRSPSDPERGINTIISRLNGERLVQLGRDGRAEPGLAQHWSLSADGLAWRFALRPGMTFQDGSPITAASAVAAIRAVLKPGDRDPRETYPALANITGLTADSPTTITVTLRRPNALLLDDLAIVGIEGAGASPAGPFRLVRQEGGTAELRAFPGYYGGVPALDHIRIIPFPSHRMSWSALLRGEVDFVYDVAPDALDSVERSPSTQVATFLRPYVTTMVFNLRHRVLRDREVRRALNAAVNRTEILQAALQNRGYPATGHLWPKHWAYASMAPRFRHDAVAARARLDAADLPVVRTTDRPVPRFSFTCLVPADDPRLERVALLLQRQLSEVDVDLRLEPVPLGDMVVRVGRGDYDAFLIELAAGHGLNLTHWFWHSTTNEALLHTGYRAADGALAAIREARSEAETRAAVAALQQAMFDDPPAAFLYWREGSRAVSRRFTIPREDDRDIMSSVARWRLAGAAP